MQMILENNVRDALRQVLDPQSEHIIRPFKFIWDGNWHEKNYDKKRSSIRKRSIKNIVVSLLQPL